MEIRTQNESKYNQNYFSMYGKLTKKYFDVNDEIVLEMMFDENGENKKLVKTEYVKKDKLSQYIKDNYLLSSKYLIISGEESQVISDEGISYDAYPINGMQYLILTNPQSIFEFRLFDYFVDNMEYWIKYTENKMKDRVEMNDMNISFKKINKNILNFDMNFNFEISEFNGFWHNSFDEPFNDYDEYYSFKILRKTEVGVENLKEKMVSNVFSGYKNILEYIKTIYNKTNHSFCERFNDLPENERLFINNYLKNQNY